MNRTLTMGDTLISAAENRAMFDCIAPKYDAASRAISLGMDRGWRRRAVAALQPQAGGHYLDIGTGTGDLLIELLRQQPHATIDGVDAAEQMLEIARHKMQSFGHDQRVQLFPADAHALDVKDTFYDGIILGFCFRNIDHRLDALREIFRVLKPGGRLVILEATYPEHPLIRWGYRIYSPIVPVIGRLMGGGSAFQYLVESIEEFPRPAEVLSQLNEVGFFNANCKPLTGGAISVYSAKKSD